MARGELTKEQLAAVNDKVRDVVGIQKRALLLSPDAVQFVVDSFSTLPTAAACISDAADTLCEVRYSLFEYHAHRLYFRELADSKERNAAVFFERYYLDNAAYRLYSAGEDVAEAVCYTLGIKDEDLSDYGKSVSSRQAKVGRYLNAKQPSDPPTPLLRRLHDSSAWRQTREYRNFCVHDQPPLVEQPGIQYSRKSRWKIDPETNTRTMVFGGGDKPEYTTKMLQGFIQPAFNEFAEALDGMIDWYREVVKSIDGGVWRLNVEDD